VVQAASLKAAPSDLPDGRRVRVALLRSLFNPSVVDGLVEGARLALAEMGTSPANVTVVDVPGAFELPLAAQAAARSRRFDAVVALGAVIKGETDHYEHVARQASAGLLTVSLETGVPVGFGVLTVAEERQALARSAPGAENKGAEAARAAVAMIHTLRGLEPVRARPRSGGKPPVRRAGLHSRRA
jgi:6,7-dimethyl-8-ribityllumazine synthase